MSAITPLGLWSIKLVPGEEFELETVSTDIQVTGLSYGAEVKGEARSSVQMSYFDRATSGFGLTPSFDSDDEDDEEYSEADETSDEDDGGVVDEEALKQAMKAAASSRKELSAAAAAAGVSPKKLANGTGDASMDKSAALDEDEDDEDDEMGSDVSEDELVEAFIGNLLPGRIEQTPVNFVLKYGDSYMFKVTGENTVYLTGHYCHVAAPDFGPDSDDDDQEYDSEIDSMSEDEDGIYDPETGLPYPDVEEDTDGERFEEIPAEAAPSKKSKAAAKAAKAHTIPAAQVDDLSMDVDDSASKAAPAAKADASTDGLSKNQKKKLKKQQAQAAASGSAQAAPEVASMEGTKTETVKVDASDNTKAKAKKASKKTTLASGLVLEDVKTGAGAAAKKGQKVAMRYIGKLQNGTIFDSNTKGKAFEFKLGAGQVIKGWDEGIVGMQPGGERRLVIPAKLAYGKSGTSGIPGNATLTFEVKLLSIK